MAVSDKYVKTCENAVRAAGALVLDWAGPLGAREKGPADLVTEVDLASQKVVREIVLAEFPDHIVLGEEDSAERVARRAGSYRWIVDPIDGTTNFVHGVPHYSVSLALEHDGELLVGAVYDPVRDECFMARAGGGAFLNGRRIQTSDIRELPQALASVGFPPQIQRDSPDLNVFIEALLRCQSIRRTGSAALNLCYVAAGRFDLSWSFSTRIWDVAAGVLMVREAGGVVASPDGGAFVLDSGQFLAAANHPLLERLCELVCQARQ
jgi:myo-inositol-1(or 4)-monophosphatase